MARFAAFDRIISKKDDVVDYIGSSAEAFPYMSTHIDKK
jgi:hypothetical protein